MEVSIDMIRLTCSFKIRDVEHFLSRFRSEPSCRYWCSSKFATYHHNFNYSQSDYSFWFACDFNGVKEDKNLSEFVVEYNPNKVPHDDVVLKIILSHMFNFAFTSVMVKGVDVAFDFKGVSRSSVFFDKSRYRRVVEFIENGSHTTYIGKRGWGGIKIYDKAKEQGLDTNWTRVEFTVRLDFELRYFRGLSDVEMSMPSIYVLDYMNIDDIKYRAYAHMVASGLATVDEFGRTIKKRLLEYANSNSHGILISEPNKKDIVKAIILYLESLVKYYPTLETIVMPF